MRGIIQTYSPILDRILKRSNLSKEKFPQDEKTWEEFLVRINNTYLDYEQDRYLLERSMEISSKEMLELNERLESAQTIAHIGHWYYDPKANYILWSKETYRIMGFDPALSPPSYEKILEAINVKYREKLKTLVEEAISEGKDYEIEVEITNPKNKKNYWAFIKGHPFKEKSDESTYLLSGTIMDITKQKQTQEELKLLNQQLVTIARKAGMSEVATSILHNVGNILNSVNISLSVLQETVNESKLNKLTKISAMILENLPNKPNYLLEDPKGKLIPHYLDDMAQHLLLEQDNIKLEIQNLNQNISHIKDIVKMQSNISGVSGISEQVNVGEVIDLAIHMTAVSPERHHININKFFDEVEIHIDKSKLLQILVNLIKNAKESLLQKNIKEKNINIYVKNQTDPLHNVEIIIEDNGIGISEDNLLRIFSMGFTTKTSGHGFGLHSAAIAAKELGGSLTAESKGKDQGAKFILTLPFVKKR